MFHPEEQYLQLIRNIMQRGYYRASAWESQPGAVPHPGTYTLLAQNMEFDLSQGWFPLMTVRQQWFKAVVAELLWYLSGSTNVNDLIALGAHVWDSWATPETAGTMGWTDGELGPIYGHQWRHFGATWNKSEHRYEQDGFDQISYIINLIRSNPNSKRMRVVGWNTPDMLRCFVATCHGDLFFNVWGDALHMELIQRSGDVPVGIPFNTACYSLLLMCMAQVTGLQPGTFYHHIVDAHLYEHQLPAMRELVTRRPLPYPRLEINPEVTDIFSFQPSDFKLIGYQHAGKLEVPVAI